MRWGVPGRIGGSEWARIDNNHQANLIFVSEDHDLLRGITVIHVGLARAPGLLETHTHRLEIAFGVSSQ